MPDVGGITSSVEPIIYPIAMVRAIPEIRIGLSDVLLLQDLRYVRGQRTNVKRIYDVA